jgi:hypothetical protein
MNERAVPGNSAATARSTPAAPQRRSPAVEAVGKLLLLLVPPGLPGSGYLQAFQPPQVAVLANTVLKSHGFMLNVALIFSGCACRIEGDLIYKPGDFPKLIGTLMQLPCSCHLVSYLAASSFPALADSMTPVILLPTLIGEASAS